MRRRSDPYPANVARAASPANMDAAFAAVEVIRARTKKVDGNAVR
jgi:hypothetical protein